MHFDEFETFEGRRNTRPLTVAAMIETRTRFLVATVAAPIRPKGRMTASRSMAIASEAMARGKRRHRSRTACRTAFRAAGRLFAGTERVVLHSDRKWSYPSYFDWAFGDSTRVHQQTSGSDERDERNPLFPINHTESVLRDLVGRLRRNSWLASKHVKYLNLHLGLYCAWRNWVRPRFNRDKKSPAQLAGFASRRLRTSELCGWRQDWWTRSISPLS